MKCRSEKLLLSSGVAKIEKVREKQVQRQRLELRGQGEGTAVRRRLEYAIGIIGRFILAIGLAVMICCIMLTGRLRLVKKVMHPVGRGVKQKKQKYRRPKGVGAAGGCRDPMAEVASHCPSTPNCTPM